MYIGNKIGEILEPIFFTLGSVLSLVGSVVGFVFGLVFLLGFMCIPVAAIKYLFF